MSDDASGNKEKARGRRRMMGNFAFILHPLDIDYMVPFEPKIKKHSPALVEKVMEWTPPWKLSDITGVRSLTGRELSGWFIGCPLLPKQMITLDLEFVLRKIIQSGEVAQELGAKIVGLGAFTSVVGDAGITVANNLEIAVTTGSSYTIASAMESIQKLTKMMDVDLPSVRVAVIGATGAIGSVCSKILAKEVSDLILVGRNQERINKLVNNISEFSLGKVEGSLDVQGSAKKSQVIVTATSATAALIGPDDLLSGAIVCDVAQPRNVSAEVASARDDVVVIEGGVIEVPGDKVDFHFDFGFPPGLAFACMSETMILALEERYENFSLGRDIDVGKAEEISRLAKKHGFKLAGFRSFDKPISDEQIERIKEKAKASRKP